MREQVLRYAQRLYRRVVPLRVPPHPFDLAHGTDTGGLIATQRTAHPEATAYWGTAPSLLRGALGRWAGTIAPYTVEEYSFLDLGSGKGRVLMLASELPFRRVVGLELDPALVAVARANLALWAGTPHACGEIEALHADALTLPLPESPVLLYLFNPFSAALIGRLVERLEALRSGRGHPIDVLYTRPDHAALLEAMPGIETIFQAEIPFSAEDTAADIFQTRQQQAFLYRLAAGPE